MRPPASICLLVLALLAGCTDPPDDGGEGPTASPAATATSGPGGGRTDTAGVRPLWFEGLQWTYAVEFPSQGVAGTMDLTVVRDDGAAWQLSAAAEEELLLWALLFHLPPLGPVDKQSFAVTIHDQPVRWLDLPLDDGKTWTAPDHNGADVTYTATFGETAAPDGRNVPAYDVVGARDGVDWVRYTYTAEFGWFTTIEVLRNGTVMARMVMQSAQATVAHLSVPSFEPRELVTFQALGVPNVPGQPSSFTVSAAATDLYAFWIMGGAPGYYSGGITLPDGSSHAYNHTQTDAAAGLHRVGVRFAAQEGSGDFGSIVLGEGVVFGELFEVVRRPPAS